MNTDNPDMHKLKPPFFYKTNGFSQKFSTFHLNYACFFLILLITAINSAATHAWDFKSATGNQFVDTGSGITQNIAKPTNYINNDYGVHLSYQSLTLSTADIFQDQFFTIYGSFYSHKSTNFYLFWEQNGIIDRFCLSSTSTGYYAITMTNSEGSQQYKATTIVARTGWNFFSIQVEYEFGYTKMILSVGNENNSPTKASEIVIFSGIYVKSSQTFNIGWKIVNSKCTLPFIGSLRSIIIDDTVVSNAVLDALYSTTWTNDGLISWGIWAVSGTGKWYEVIETTPKIKYLSLDIGSTTTATTSIIDTSGDNHSFSLSTAFPFRIPEQGYKFEKNKYLIATTGFTLPESFTINTWFRVNTNTSIPDTQMQYLFLKYDSGGTTNKLFIGLTNTYLRIYIEGATYDYPEAFSSTSTWRYLSVSFYKTSASTTSLIIFLDSTKVATQSLVATLTDSVAYNVYVGKDFEGSINIFEIVPMNFLDLTIPPLLINTGCTPYGSTTSCSICPRTSTTTGICLSNCGLGTYDSNCNAWNWKWEYCTAAGANCISCGMSLEGGGAAPVTCTCKNGYYDNSTSCERCNSLCGTCSGSLSTDCLSCANDAYLNGVSTWVATCPTYYSPNVNLRKCQLDTNSLLTYIYDPASQANGCTYNQYWDGTACQTCHSDCLTCSGSLNTNCLSCPLGRYINSNACPVWDATDMTIGSSGIWVETCGKSKNYGLLECDNGGATGCTSWVIEDGYIWSGGTISTPDVCSYILGTFRSTEKVIINETTVSIKEIVVTDKNNIYVYFDREMKAVGNISTSTFTITVSDSNGVEVKGVGWEIPSDYYTQYSAADAGAFYIYFSLTIPKTLAGGSKGATVSVQYHNVSGTGRLANLIFRCLQRFKWSIFSKWNFCNWPSKHTVCWSNYNWNLCAQSSWNSDYYICNDR